MKQVMLEDAIVEREILEYFGVPIEVHSVIARRMPVGRSLEATLFLSNKKQLYLYINGQSPLLLSDVKKIVSRAGMVSDSFMPPKNQPNYFDDIGVLKFQEIFPGRKTVSAEDIAFYRTLAPYNPALIAIREVKNGIVYQFDSDARDGWRPNVKFSYRRIATS